LSDVNIHSQYNFFLLGDFIISRAPFRPVVHHRLAQSLVVWSVT